MLSELASIFNFNKGFLFTIKELLLRPGLNIQKFILEEILMIENPPVNNLEKICRKKFLNRILYGNYLTHEKAIELARRLRLNEIAEKLTLSSYHAILLGIQSMWAYKA